MWAVRTRSDGPRFCAAARCPAGDRRLLGRSEEDSFCLGAAHALLLGLCRRAATRCPAVTGTYRGRSDRASCPVVAQIAVLAI